MNFKWTETITTTKNLESVQLYEVRWFGQADQYHFSFRPEVEAFTTHEAAVEFANSLDKAFKLIRRIGSKSEVTVSKG